MDIEYLNRAAELFFRMIEQHPEICPHEFTYQSTDVIKKNGYKTVHLECIWCHKHTTEEKRNELMELVSEDVDNYGWHLSHIVDKKLVEKLKPVTPQDYSIFVESNLKEYCIKYRDDIIAIFSYDEYHNEHFVYPAADDEDKKELSKHEKKIDPIIQVLHKHCEDYHRKWHEKDWKEYEKRKL